MPRNEASPSSAARGSGPFDFALIGAAGYIAPRHMQAIKAIGADLKAALDPKDATGAVSGHFPQANLFVELDQFDRHVDALKRRGEGIDYVSICSPTYLHEAHCAHALRSDADAICEKPIGLNPSVLDALEEIEVKSGRRVFAIQQLRLHPAIEALRSRVLASSNSTFSVDVTYVTAREPWYHASWKGDHAKSGGIVMNIGLHFIDALIHVFGPATLSIVHLRDYDRAAGFLACGRATVRWFLSVNADDLPPTSGTSTYRSLNLDNEEIDLSNGLVELHTRSYQEIVAGRGLDLRSTRPAIEIASAFATAPIEPHRGERHPLVQKHLKMNQRHLVQGAGAFASPHPGLDPSSL